MARELIVNNIPFDYPDAGDEPGWGGQATDWAEAATEAISDLIGPDDILQTTFTPANNQSTFADITGLIFDGASVRSAIVTYAVARTSSSTLSGKTETGTMHIVYDNALGWSIAFGGIVGNSGIIFDITSGGQVQYKTTDIGATSYVAVMKFSARALQQ